MVQNSLRHEIGTRVASSLHKNDQINWTVFLPQGQKYTEVDK